MEPGRTLLHYRLVEQIGEGGMGVVWKAVDTSLGRDVAIKLLPAAFSEDAERLARFEREARLLASLDHPNIAVVHGLHEADGARFLAMELVQGEDLADRLARGPLSLERALAVAAQIAGALEAAHAQGVIHRDLKPANVMLTTDGRVKVLDFGLAKVAEPDAASGSGSGSLSPTMTSAGTVAGMLLGTAAYMAPEQARAKPVDRRADLWAFGCVTYECLTGEQLFRGETVSDSLAAILRKDPDWSKLPDDTPPLVRLLLRRCLTRDPAQRLQDAGDARIEIEQAIADPRGESLGLPSAGPDAGTKRSGAGWLPWAVAGAALLLAAFLGLTRSSPEPAPAESRRLTIPVPGPTDRFDSLATPPAISPDGRFVVFGATDGAGLAQLWLRALDDFDARPLPDTEDASFAFWSPDSRHVGFFRGGRLRRIEVGTDRQQAIGGEGWAPRGATWSRDGQILFAPNSNTGIHLIDAGGGTARQITTPDPEINDSSHRWPALLPDGEHFLYVLWTNDLQAQEEHGGVYLASLAKPQEATKLLPEASSVAYAPPGYLLVVREDDLIAVPFDAGRREIRGEAKLIASGVLWNRGNGHGAFAVSAEGTLVYAGGEAFLPSSLVWYDREGNVTPTAIDPVPYLSVRLSPDSARATVAVVGASDSEIWMVDLTREVQTRLVHGPSSYGNPVWSADGRRLMHGSQERGSTDVYTRPADGSGEPELVLFDELDKLLWDWSNDGKYVAYWPVGSGGDSPDLWVHSTERGESKALIAGEPAYGFARFSPDGRFLAYVSDEPGRNEVFVQAFAGGDGMRGGGRWQVSTAGGERPLWRGDGREIVYVDPDRRVMAVSVEEQTGSLSLGRPRELFTVEDTIVAMDATGDLQRFLVAVRDPAKSEPLRVVLNWPADL